MTELRVTRPSGTLQFQSPSQEALPRFSTQHTRERHVSMCLRTHSLQPSYFVNVYFFMSLQSSNSSALTKANCLMISCERLNA